MTQEEKINLVLTDICGRLPHGVITKNCRNNFDVSANMLPDVNVIKQLIAEYDLKPYLRPMSSMTEKEKVEIRDLYHQNTQELFKDPPKIRGYRFYDISVVDWLNAHHFDYRGLITMGLALEAPDGMYNN
jgi:hypothetical protein